MKVYKGNLRPWLRDRIWLARLLAVLWLFVAPILLTVLMWIREWDQVVKVYTWLYKVATNQIERE